MKTFLSPHRSPDPDGIGAIAANTLLAAAVPLVLFVAPLLVGQFIHQIGLSASEAGYIISIELGAMCLATIPAFWWIGRIDLRIAAAVALGIVIAGDAASIFAGSFWQLAAVRFCTGLGGGSIMALCMRAMALTTHKDRNFGYWLAAQLVSGVGGLMLMPYAFALGGLAAFYGTVMILLLAIAPLIRYLPAALATPAKDESVTWVSPWSVIGAVAILGVLLYYIAISGVWTYVERIGERAGMAPEIIANALAGATVMGVLGAATAAVIGGRFNRTLPIAGGFAILAVSIVLFLGQITAERFIVAACLFKFAWTFVIPFVFASISASETSGRLIVATNFVIAGGLSIGPAIAASLLERGLSYDTLLVTMLIIGGASAAATLLACLRGERGHESKAIPVG